MDFEISEKMQAILEMMNEFVDKELIPLEPEFLKRSFVDLLPELQEKRSLVKQMELWAPQHPKDYGGMGLDLVEFGLVSEALGRSPLGHFVFGARRRTPAILKYSICTARRIRRRNTSSPLVDGKDPELFFHDRGRICRDPTRPCLKRPLSRTGDDYIINGHKWYSSAADGSQFSICMAVTNPEASPYLQGQHDHRSHGHPGVQSGAEHTGHGT